MSTTLTNGYKLPADGDKGSTFFDDLESNIQRVNDHTHNGSNSEKLTAASVTTITQDIPSSGWTNLTNGVYSQTVSMSSSLKFDEVAISFKIASGTDDGHIVHPTIKKTATSQYIVYLNDNSVNLKAIYS